MPQFDWFDENLHGDDREKDCSQIEAAYAEDAAEELAARLHNDGDIDCESEEYLIQIRPAGGEWAAWNVQCELIYSYSATEVPNA